MKKALPANAKRVRSITTRQDTRIALRLEPLLLEALDKFISDNGREMSRSEAIRDLLADELVTLGILRPTAGEADN